MKERPALQSLSDDELLRGLSELMQQSRRVESDLIAHIAEVDERRLYAREAFPSMFAYCRDFLHLSEAEAYLRIRAGRASRRHPQLLNMLADGRLHLSGIGRLAPHLEGEKAAGLLERAVHLSKRQIEELIAELLPQPDAPAVMRKLPAPRVHTRLKADLSLGEGERTSSELGLVHQRHPDGVARPDSGTGPELAAVDPVRPDEVAMPDPELTLGRAALNGDQVECIRPLTGTGLDAVANHLLRPDAVGASQTSRAPSPELPARVQPLAPGRYKVQFTASAAFHDKLERLRTLMQTSVPDGDLAAILESAVTEKLERLEARRFATTKAPKKGLSQTDTSAKSHRVPAAVRRAVTEHDGQRCRYADAEGRRCPERHRLEFHHRHPYGYGGDHGPRNIWLVCASHNQYLAEQDYGRRSMAPYQRSGTSVSALLDTEPRTLFPGRLVPKLAEEAVPGKALS